MSSRRTLILVAAIVIGGLAAFMTMRYVSGVENESAERNQLVDVLVATGPIGKGQSADEALAAGRVTVDQRRRADLPAAAARRAADIQGQVASVEMSGGEIITTSMFLAETDLSGSKSMTLDKGNVAITIMVSGGAGVAGLVQPGDLINIMAQVEDKPAEGESANAGSGAGGLGVDGSGFISSTNSMYAFQAVKVLAVGTRLDVPQPTAEKAPEASAESSSEAPVDYGDTSLITVQLPPDQALKLASLREAGLYLTLNRPDYEPIPSPLTMLVTDLPGLAGISPYPARPDSDGGQ